ncbi:MAG: polysaccharide lyase 6 family protein [Verrucomicrobiota bacterium]
MRSPALPCLLLLACATFAPLHAENAYRMTAPADVAGLAYRYEPGDVVILPDTTWTDQKLVFKGKGTAEKPITLRASTPGQFILSGKSSLTIEGEYLVVEGITLKNFGIEGAEGILIKGRHNRLTASVIDGGIPKFFVRLYGTHHRVDHCYFANKTSGDPTLQIEVDEKEPNYHRLDRNHFGYRAPLGVNGGETIRVGYSGQSLWNSRTTVEENLFERCDGEIEIISSKSCENTYRANTFRECDGMLTLRHGNRNVVDGNFFFGGGKPNSGGIRVIGEDHVITNNYIEGVKKGGIWITSGVPNSELKQYFQVKRATIAFNTIVDFAGPGLDLAAGLGGAGRTLKPEHVTIANNLIAPGAGGKLLQGEEGEAWQWTGNLVSFATASKVEHPGIRSLDAHLERGAGGLLRPAEKSPARGAAEGSFPAIATDIDGQKRTGKLDIGCDQASAAPARHRPLVAADVGPEWLTERGRANKAAK